MRRRFSTRQAQCAIPGHFFVCTIRLCYPNYSATLSTAVRTEALRPTPVKMRDRSLRGLRACAAEDVVTVWPVSRKKIGNVRNKDTYGCPRVLTITAPILKLTSGL